jgi:hypothetical protein|tara:strand:- start:5641 stop:6876 length:1236 start_codon:yes stop_codon:yes gene_type:complete
MANFGSNQEENLVSVENTNLQKDVLLDPITVEQTANYINNGLTVVSNNTDIIPRDAAGNVIVQDGSYIVIETNSFNIDNISMLKVLDTQFNYFKFPVSVNREFLDPNFEFNFDNISAKLTVPTAVDGKGQPVNFVRINTSYDSTWFYNDGGDMGEAAGQESSGFKQVTFTGGFQETPNSYTIDKSRYDALIEQGKTLKFTIQVQFTSQIKTSRVGMVTRLFRGNRTNYHPLPEDINFYTDAGANPSGQTTAKTNPYGFSNNEYPVLNVEYIINMDDTFVGDTYRIETFSGDLSYILAESCEWDVSVVDPIPTPITPDSLYQNPNTVYQNFAGSVINIGFDNAILKRTQNFVFDKEKGEEVPTGVKIDILAKRTLENNYEIDKPNTTISSVESVADPGDPSKQVAVSNTQEK